MIRRVAASLTLSACAEPAATAPPRFEPYLARIEQLCDITGLDLGLRWRVEKDVTQLWFDRSKAVQSGNFDKVACLLHYLDPVMEPGLEEASEIVIRNSKITHADQVRAPNRKVD